MIIIIRVSPSLSVRYWISGRNCIPLTLSDDGRPAVYRYRWHGNVWRVIEKKREGAGKTYHLGHIPQSSFFRFDETFGFRLTMEGDYSISLSEGVLGDTAVGTVVSGRDIDDGQTQLPKTKKSVSLKEINLWMTSGRDLQPEQS